MPTRCYYSVVRYVPDDIREEGINIGVVLESQDAHSDEPLHAFTRNFSRVVRLDSSLDRRELQQVLGALLARLKHHLKTARLCDLLPKYSGGPLRLTPPRLSITDNLANELKQLRALFVTDRASTRELGFTEPRLLQDVKTVIAGAVPAWPEVVRFARRGQRLVYNGSRAEHEFDLAIHSNERVDVFRCISFDVKGYTEKIDAAKVLTYDARDFKDSSIRVSSVLYPPQHYLNGHAAAFQEATAILQGDGIPTFDFSKEDDRKGLVSIVQSRFHGHV
jgi:hypothetical protein